MECLAISSKRKTDFFKFLSSDLEYSFSIEAEFQVTLKSPGLDEGILKL